MKVPCGGFKIDNDTLKLKDDGTLYAAGGGGGSIPKPLGYDYMPEGYPSKSIGTVTLIEEQEVAFADTGGAGGRFGATSPVILDVISGDKLTVVWDGVSYNVTVKAPEMGPPGALAFGNLGLTDLGDTEDYPFVYLMVGPDAQWGTADAATSHTIKVMRQQETITPMSADFMPVVDGVIISSSTADSTKKFKITVDDSGTIKATEVT